MAASVGFRVIQKIQRPSRELIQTYAAFDVSHVGDAMHRFGVLDSAIKPLYDRMPRIAGPAVTVKVFPGDHLLIRKAMELVEPGDVLVIDGQGCLNRAVWGGLASEVMVKRGLAGVVIDGATRDLEDIRGVQLPVYARALTPAGPLFNGPGEVNTPISCGGQVVCPGDIVIGDADGVVVVPLADAEALIENVKAIANKEASWAASIAAGEIFAIDQVNKDLAEQGCSFE